MSTPRERVTAYLERRRNAWGTDFEHIHGFDVGPDCGVELLASDLEAILEAPAIPLPAAPVQGWQPIETAPKEMAFGYGDNNYGPYLLLTDGHEVVRGRWWFHEDGAKNFIRDGGIAFHASHYIHLPPPPVGENE